MEGRRGDHPLLIVATRTVFLFDFFLGPARHLARPTSPPVAAAAAALTAAGFSLFPSSSVASLAVASPWCNFSYSSPPSFHFQRVFLRSSAFSAFFFHCFSCCSFSFRSVSVRSFNCYRVSCCSFASSSTGACVFLHGFPRSFDFNSISFRSPSSFSFSCCSVSFFGFFVLRPLWLQLVFPWLLAL